MPMSTDRFRACVEQVNWSLRQLSRVMDVNFSTVQRWANGKNEIAPDVETWLETIAACHAKNPPPQRHFAERRDPSDTDD